MRLIGTLPRAQQLVGISKVTFTTFLQISYSCFAHPSPPPQPHSPAHHPTTLLHCVSRSPQRCPHVLRSQIVSPATQMHLPCSASHVSGNSAGAMSSPHTPSSLPPRPPRSQSCLFCRSWSGAAVHAERGEIPSRIALPSAARHPKLTA